MFSNRAIQFTIGQVYIGVFLFLMWTVIFAISYDSGGKDVANELLIPSAQLTGVTLVAIWVALGRAPAPLKLVVVSTLIALWSRGEMPFGDTGVTRLLYFSLVGVVGVPLLMVRHRRGIRFDWGLEISQEESLANRPMQDSLRDLLLWTTAVVVSLGLLASTSRHGLRDYLISERELLAIFPLILGTASLAMIAIRVVWFLQNWGSRIFLAVVVSTVLVVVLTAILTPWLGLYAWMVGVILTISYLMLLATLVLFRAAGCRLTWYQMPQAPGK